MEATSRHDGSCWLGRTATIQTNKPMNYFFYTNSTIGNETGTNGKYQSMNGTEHT